MNTLAKQIVGAIIGGAIGLFVGQVIVDYIEYVNNPIEEDYEDYEETEEFPEGEEADESNLDKELLQRPTTMSKRSKAKNYTEFFVNQNRPDLAALAAKYNGEDLPEPPTTVQDEIGGIARPITDEEDFLEEEVDFEMIEEDDSVDPRVISMEEYAEDNELTRMTLHYYSDDILTDENDKPIKSPESLVGEDALVSFGEKSNDEDVVYVQNLEKNTMYEIVRLHKPYADTTVRKHIASKRLKEEYDGEDNHS